MKISIDAQIAIRSFAQSLIAGDFGPDDSRYSRSQFFLKNPNIVGQAMAVFLYRLELDQGKVHAVWKLHEDGVMSIDDICKMLRISRSTFYRYVRVKI
jgi:hypothetical protein